MAHDVLLYFDLYKIGPTRPVTLVKEDRFADVSARYKLRLEPNDVLVEFSGDSIDGGALERRYILHYAIRGETAERIAPVALLPEDFVEEWLTRPWQEAARWSDPAQLANLEAWHVKMNAKRPSGEFWLAQQCGTKTDWQVGFESYDSGHLLSGETNHALRFQDGRRKREASGRLSR